ncbi:MAG TPA: IS1595 family transposase, partial [Xanthobacteraceae bacterium]|nr:IS1595 family transposase [Xanthobacteraceae bacterium]
MTATFRAPIFTDENAAREALEAVRWPDGPVCPHCGSTGDDVARIEGKSARPGLFYCNGCKGQFTVTVGTVFERSKISLTKWWLAAHLLNSSKKGISAHQMHRTLGVTYKTAWFMMHRLREAMRELSPAGPLGGEGKTVEIDETYIGGKDKNRHVRKRKGKGGMEKEIAFSLLERGGKVRSHHVPSVTAKTLRPILQAQIDAATTVMSDAGGSRLSAEFERHAMVNHSIGEYVRGDAHTNTIEGYFSILKRGINGVYHHVSAKH